MGRLLAGLGLLLICSTASSAERPAVRWLTMDVPPYHILQGEDADTGVYDRFLRQLQQDLPDFAHVIEKSSSSRMEALMKNGAPVCTIAKLKTPGREAFSVFSREPFLSLLPLRLVTLLPVEELAQGNGQEAVSLKDLLQRRVVSLGLLDTRRHGLAIDRIVDTAPEGQVFRFRADPLLSRSLAMIEHGRFNATLGYSAEIHYLQQTGKVSRPFRYYALQESERLLDAYVSCSRTALGRRVIEAVDRLPEQRPATRDLVADYEARLPDDERRRYAALRTQRRD